MCLFYFLQNKRFHRVHAIFMFISILDNVSENDKLRILYIKIVSSWCTCFGDVPSQSTEIQKSAQNQIFEYFASEVCVFHFYIEQCLMVNVIHISCFVDTYSVFLKRANFIKLHIYLLPTTRSISMIST